MLYLAEVQKQKGGLLGGGGKTELRLLACQRNDQSWSTVSEEVINSEEASKLNDGALVLVEVNPQRQVQRIQEAGRPLVNILQNFSRQLEKFKLKEEEIDQWKQSLTFQAQELNRREMDMEVRIERLQHKEDEMQHLEAQRQEVETSRQRIERLREEIERKRQELEGAWEHLRGEQRNLDESKAQFQQQGTVLDEEQSRTLSELLERLSNGVAPTQTLQEQFNLAVEMVDRQQTLLNPHWQQLEAQKTAVDEQEAEIERLTQVFLDLQNEWQQNQNSLEQQTVDLKVNTEAFKNKQEYAQMLKQQLQHQEDLYQQIFPLAESSNSVLLSQKVDVKALEAISLEELQKIIQEQQQKLDIDSSFVNDQEQELKLQQETIEELQSKIKQSSEDERSKLETELAEEKDRYQMLNETLVGQRRSLLEQQEILRQHQTVLQRRQGYAPTGQDQKIDFGPILVQIETQRQQQSEELQKLQREIEQMDASIELTQGMLEHQAQDQEMKRGEMQTMEQNLLSLRTTTAESCGQMNFYQETLQPIQDCLDELRQKLQEISEILANQQETGDAQLETLTQMRQSLLTPNS